MKTLLKTLLKTCVNVVVEAFVKAFVKTQMSTFLKTRALYTREPNTSFLPLLMHVNLYPPTVVMEFNFVHVKPALTAANANCGGVANVKTKSATKSFSVPFISRF